MNMFTLDDFAEEEKRVLVRVDFNVPVDKEGNITNDNRIKLAVRTFKHLLNLKSKIIVMTHFKRPKGKVVEEFRVTNIAQRFSELINFPVKKLDSVIGQEIEEEIEKQMGEEIIFLENIQFEPGETENDEKLAKTLASYADVFVLDAFGQAHRSYASLCKIQEFLPTFAGRIVESEIDNLEDVKEGEEPIVAIIGGAKKDKIKSIKTLLEKGYEIIVGGVLANTFLKASGIDIKGSKYDEDGIELAKEIIANHREKISLPVDAIAGSEFSNEAEKQVCGLDSIPDNWLIMDIGPVTVQMYKDKLSSARTIFWGGPIGVFEFDNFSDGTREIAQHIARLDVTKVIGGGESAAAVISFGLEHDMTFISSGGGASLDYVSGKELPALKALEENCERFS